MKALILLDQSGMVENWDPQNAGTFRTKLQKQNTPRNFETEAQTTNQSGKMRAPFLCSFIYSVADNDYKRQDI